jgi:hypothetical protein
MISEKDKLAAKSVEQLKAAAKRLGGKLVTPDGKAKTKQQLINTIVMKKRLAGVGMALSKPVLAIRPKIYKEKQRPPVSALAPKAKYIPKRAKIEATSPALC